MDISIIIPNYNGENLLKENLPRVYKEVSGYKQGKVEIIVVDDGSKDESVLSIKKYVSGIKNGNVDFKILENEKNLGFAPTVNKGVKASTGEVVILLNTDVYPEEGFLEPLLKHFSEKQVFAVGCLERSIEENAIVLRGRGLGEWKRGFLVHRRGEIDKTNTLWASGGSSAFSKSLWEKLGGLNELYTPFYYEDIDLSYRALKSGYEVIFEPKSIVVHEHEKGVIKSKYSKFKVKTITYRNQFIFVWENITDASFWITHIAWLPYHFSRALIDYDWSFFLGFINAFLLMPKILKLRHEEQKQFMKKDMEVIREFV